MHDLQELSLHNKGDDGSDKKVFHIIGKIHQFFRISLFRGLFRTKQKFGFIKRVDKG